MEMKHDCAEDKTCCCSTVSLEPNERCPVHGAGSYPKRCGRCGKFIARLNTPRTWEGFEDERNNFMDMISASKSNKDKEL